MCQFDYQPFCLENGVWVVAFHADKFSLEDAAAIARYELYAKKHDKLDCRHAWGYYGIGRNHRGERINQYWLTAEKRKYSFPVLVFYIRQYNEVQDG